jgi:glycosyltransferase involved in cell wall biosynthesis
MARALRVTSPLILTSSTRSVAVRNGERPRRDYELLASHVGGRIQYPGGGARTVRRIERSVRLDVSQAIRARRSRASVYVSFSERVGIPLATLAPASPHLLIAHLLTSKQKLWAQRLSGYLGRIDRTLVFSRAQERHLREHVGLSADQVEFVSDKVDSRFFTPGEMGRTGDYVLSVGREQRDYQTLLEALRPSGIPCVIVPGSMWSHRDLPPLELSDRIEIREGLSYVALRELYRHARLVVVPVLPEVDYAAGVNGILEGMSCGKPVVASDTPGLQSYVRDGVDGRNVKPGDPVMLRAVIEELWDEATQRDQLGRAARETVERERTIEQFATRVATQMAMVTG